MNKKSALKTVCSICGKPKRPDELVPAALIREAIVELIRKDHPEWSPDGSICRDDLNRYRARFVERVLEADKGDLTAIETAVIKSLREGEVLSRNVGVEFEDRRTAGERVADRMASFGGSWKFILIFLAVLVVWIVVNSVYLLVRHFDPYPFILLNLVLSCLAAIQAPVIMMSQNRQEAKDRMRSEHDYQVNLKAEIEIRSLHEKIDHLIFKQWQRLLEIQEIQTELMEELSARAPSRREGPAGRRRRQAPRGPRR
jgi:uncharacterized membrane protein